MSRAQLVIGPPAPSNTPPESEGRQGLYSNLGSICNCLPAFRVVFDYELRSSYQNGGCRRVRAGRAARGTWRAPCRELSHPPTPASASHTKSTPGQCGLGPVGSQPRQNHQRNFQATVPYVPMQGVPDSCCGSPLPPGLCPRARSHAASPSLGPAGSHSPLS